jgi:hypothetical protein
MPAHEVPLSRTCVLMLAPNVTVQALGPDEGGVALRLDSGEMYTLNDTALDFLQRLDGEQTIEAVARELVSVIDVEADVLAADLVEMADGLIRESLVVVRG